MLTLELTGDHPVLVNDTLLYDGDVLLDKLKLLVLLVQRHTHIATVNQVKEQLPLLAHLKGYHALHLLLQILQFRDKLVSREQSLLKHLEISVTHGVRLLFIFLQHLVDLRHQRYHALAASCHSHK